MARAAGCSLTPFVCQKDTGRLGVRLTPTGNVILMLIQAIGYLAGILTTFGVLPEIVKLIQRKRADELSYTWLSTVAVGIGLWSIYGFFINSLPLFLVSAIQTLLYFYLILLKYYYDRRREIRKVK